MNFSMWRQALRIIPHVSKEEWQQFVLDKYGTEPNITYFDSPIIVDNLTEEIIES